MNELSLFTGAGGGVLASKLLGWRTIGYVECEKYCREVIKQRIRDGILDAAPIFGDIRTFVRDGYAGSYQGMVDVLSAGFPCQPFSAAGKRLGADDSRNMWPATLDCIRTIRPRFCLLENVPGLVTSGYYGTILRGLAQGGYDARWRMLSAAELGASHRRDRLWILAYPKGERWHSESRNEDRNPRKILRQGLWGYTPREFCGKEFQRALKSIITRDDDGMAYRMDRLKATGNGQVPAVAATAWNLLTEGSQHE